ncbi:uncharacterized protein LOC124363603 [Homalodisca vitripennis]|uniref:uncharacterized protein LOC124363603 n=1 Tax=Homalodisca vitripennis TaxID=197043 RepID=UPI001EEA23C9|nr:uncharacterized protein LOC124363603 [Homalodisca vitripennis]
MTVSHESPIATLIATIMCVSGVGIFCGTMHRGVTLTTLMLDEVFHMRLGWLEPVEMLFVILGGCMAALGLMILFVGFLATGATRHKVYRAWTARVSGRISCAVAELGMQESTNGTSKEEQILLGWVPGHKSVPGNEVAVALAKIASDSLWVGPDPGCEPVPFS